MYEKHFRLTQQPCGLDSRVIPLGLEPKTVCLEGRCSIQLSYGTIYQTVQRCEIEMHYLYLN